MSNDGGWTSVASAEQTCKVQQDVVRGDVVTEYRCGELLRLLPWLCPAHFPKK